ncbi:MAG: 4-(cytidine 5'-diphospho)-2-C-methyl-D-erythritol kinase [Hasllibacter sp.]
MTTEASGRLAPAKVNLTLAVTGRRADGYHLLDSLIVFAGIGDVIAVAPGPDLTLTVTGPMAAGVPADGRNLVLRAAQALRAGAGAAITLDKRLPHGGGIGGGSSDAAAALALLSRLWGVPALPPEAGLALGADVPVCRAAPGPQFMRGIGERVLPAPDLPGLWIVLAAPPVHLSTPEVFRSFAAGRAPSRRGPAEAPPSDPAELIAWLSRAERNDLAAAAYALEPSLRAVRDEMAGGALAAGLSGSGAAHWALHGGRPEAEAQAAALRAAHPDWWVAAGPVLAVGDRLDAPERRPG